MPSDDLIGICGEYTTYRDEFREFEVKKIHTKQFRDRKKLKTNKVAISCCAESHDTFQKLNYDARPRFDALWRPKEIVGTDPRSSLYKKYQPDVNENFDVTRTKLSESVSPAVNLDDIKDSETRKLVANYVYKSTVARADEEVWPNFGKNYDKANDEIINSKPGESVPTKSKLMPIEFKSAAKTWDSLQNRRRIDRKNSTADKSGPSRPADANDCDHQRHISELLRSGKKLRLPYEKLPSSYGGHRTPVALGVPLEKKDISPYHPDLTVSQTLTRWVNPG